MLALGTSVPAVVEAQTYPDQPYPQQGYPQQQQYPQQPYPQQDYPQQQQQYPQPQYPDQQYPQQGYPQQQYPQQPQNYPPPSYGNQPPPGYYTPAPAPAYAQPAYPPAAAYQPPPLPRYRQGFLWLPYVGANIPVGDTANGLGTGLRLGAIFGLNVNSFLSLNGEMCVDVLNIKDTPTTTATGAVVDFTFSPLFHFGVPMMEFVVGPKIGSFYASETYTISSGSYSTSQETYSGEGVSYGFNAGAFLSLGRVALGGLISYTARDYQNCTACSFYGTDHVFGLTGALMY